MKKISVLLFITGLAILTNHLSAHALWLETEPFGTKDKEHQIHIFYGEYSYGIKEKSSGEAFEKVKNFKLWLVAPNGKKTMLNAITTDSCFTASFIPQKEGLYTVVLDNNEIEVLDYTQYNFGIFKTHYHSVAKIQIGQAPGSSMLAENSNGLAIIDKSDSSREVNLQVLYMDKALTDCEVEISLPDQWKKIVKTDDNGMVSFKTPWKAHYLIEVTKKEEVPGTYRDKDYEFVWHCVTYFIKAK